MNSTTGRGDTLYGITAAVVSVGLVLFGCAALLLAQHDLHAARDRLSATLFSVARSEHRSPRDPALLPAVARRLPGGVRLEPTSTFPVTGRVLVLWHRFGRTHRACLILPAAPDVPIAACS